MGSRRVLAIFFAVFLVLAFSISVGATTTTGGATATTVAATTGEPIVPAVSVEVTEAPEDQPDWTYRFFIPTLLVLAALVVIGTVIQYFTRVVRNRYRVIR